MRKLAFFFILMLSLGGCKKDEQAPDLQLKSGGSYVTGDFVAAPGTQFTVGVNAYKTSAKLHLFYTEAAFDGDNTSHLVSRVWLSGDQQSQYSQDITITLRSQPGTERWIFNVNDDDGRLTRKEIRVTVQ